MFRNIKMSLADICGADYAASLASASAAVGNMKYEEAVALANKAVDFCSEADMARGDALLDKVGQQVVAPFANDIDGAPTDSFRKAESKSASPLVGFGNFRLGEDGRLYLIGKSEHYHASLGHSFGGYRLIDHARRLGIPNATHNNTRGYITRLCERRLVQTANGIDWNDDAATEAVIASRQPHVLNRVINLETGSLAVEAGVKMMLARFYRLSPELDKPKYEGKTPVFLVMADNAGDKTGNYHGTTVLTQTFRGLWGGMYEAMEQAGLYKVVPVDINDIDSFAANIKKYNSGKYKTAGFLHEIVMMNYGGIRLEREFLHEAYRLCAESDTPALVDEIQTCMWYGGMFLFRKYGLQPDFAVIGKGFPGGEYPASKILTTAEYDNLNQFGALVTNGQEELASLAYLITMCYSRANSNEIDRVSDVFEQGMNALVKKYPDRLVKAEGMGLLSALHFKTLTEAADFTHALHDACLDASAQLYKANCVPAVLFKPPVNAGENAINKILEILDTTLSR